MESAADSLVLVVKAVCSFEEGLWFLPSWKIHQATARLEHSTTMHDSLKKRRRPEVHYIPLSSTVALAICDGADGRRL